MGDSIMRSSIGGTHYMGGQHNEELYRGHPLYGGTV